MLADGVFDVQNIWFPYGFDWERDRDIVHRDVYVCRAGEQTYTPTFTYHGFRYVKVSGITPEQATSSLLTYVVLHSDLETRGGFECSNKTLNTLQILARRSALSNFHYFATDCPHREKNGWTADAALSAEYVLLNFAPEKSYREWMRGVCAAQDERGALPGIVPTSGWGFKWGNGPAWDSVLVYIPYFTYVLRGESDMIHECRESFVKYLRYIESRRDERGLIAIGLGDWCHAGGVNPPKAPLVFTDSVMSMDIAAKAAFLLSEAGYRDDAEYARSLSHSFREAIRRELIDFDSMLAVGNCQTTQAMSIFYGVFEEDEKARAAENLVKLVHEADDFMDVGVLGGRVIFHVLSEFGSTDLAIKMIARPEFPSYGNWLERGATTLWESFLKDIENSRNHHFWGDISAWFIKTLAGIRYNPDGKDIGKVLIKPAVGSCLDSASAWYDSPRGRIEGGWKKENGGVKMCVVIPDAVTAELEVYGKRSPIVSGEYFIKEK
jgi:alpha-L-rhamnosidase